MYFLHTALLWTCLQVTFVYSSDVTLGLVGESSLLGCSVAPSSDDKSPYVIQWLRQKQEVPVFMKIGKHPAIVTPHFRGRLKLLDNSAVLRIKDLRLADEGWYQCRILYLDDKPTSNGTWLHLVINESPAFRSTSPPSMTGRENEPIKLHCRVVGKPQPEITWRKDGWLLESGKDGIIIDGGMLEIPSLQQTHRGNYVCQGTNQHGQIEHTTTVYVKAPPEIDVPPKNVTVKEGQDAFFSCKASGYPTSINYRWSYNGTPVADAPSLRGRYNAISDGTFVIYDVTKLDKGNVTCRPDNGYGSAPSASAFLVVQYAAYVTGMPSIAYAGLTLPFKMRCNAEAEPAVSTVTWRKGGQVIMSQQTDRVYVDSDQVLVIREVQYIDEGQYTCTPYNILGTSGESSKIRLVAKQPPRFTLEPQESYEVEIGTALRVNCVGKGDPPPSTYWRKVSSEGELPNERVFWEEGNLTISSVSKEDFGLWQCVVSNAVADVMRDVMIYVKYTTPHNVKNVSVVTTPNSANIEWIPGYDGGYPQHFMIWYKRASMGDHSWSTVYADGSRKSAVVSKLEPETVYQFAILPENVLGSGPFSKTATAKTQVIPVNSPKLASGNSIAPPSDVKYTFNDQGLIVLSWRPSDVSDLHGMLGYLVECRVLVDVKRIPAPSKRNDEEVERRRRSVQQSKMMEILEGEKISSSMEDKFRRASGMQKVPGSKRYLKEAKKRLSKEGRSFSKEEVKSLSQEERRFSKDEDESILAEDEKIILSKKEVKRSLSNKEEVSSLHRVIRSDPIAVENNRMQMQDYDGWRILAALPTNITTYTVAKGDISREKVYEFRILAVSPSAYSAPSQVLVVDTRGMASYDVLLSPSTASAGAIAGIVVGCIAVVVLLTIAAIYCRSRNNSPKFLQRTSYIAEEGTESFLGSPKSKQDLVKQSPQKSSEGSSLKVSFVKTTTEKDGGTKGKDGMMRKIRSKLSRTKSLNENKQAYITVKRSKSLSQGNQASKVKPIKRSADGKFHPDDSSSSSSNEPRRSDTLRSVQSANRGHQGQALRKLRPVSDSFLPRELQRFRGPSVTCIKEDEEAEDEDGPSLEIDCSRSDIEVRYLPHCSDVSSGSNRTLSPRKSNLNSPGNFTKSTISLPQHHGSRAEMRMRATSFCDTPPIEKMLHNQQHPHFGSMDRANVQRSSGFRNTPPIDPRYPPAEYVFLKDLGLSCPGTPGSEGPGSRCFSPFMDPMMSSHNPTPADPPKIKYHQHVGIPGGHYHLSPRASPADIQQQNQNQQEDILKRSQEPAKNDPRTFRGRKIEEQKTMTLPPIRETGIAPRCKPLNLTPSHENARKKQASRIHSLPSFATHSNSMPSLSPRAIGERAPSITDQRCASEDLLNAGEDTDSELRCSFTSGSASTVRRLPSKDSNLNVMDDRLGIQEPLQSTVQQKQLRRNSNSSVFTPTASDVSSSDVTSTLRDVTGSDVTMPEQSSGYESQNTSSDISSFTVHHDAHDKLQLFIHDSSSHHHDHVHDAHGVRNSDASSVESRSRRDNSSVDDKYEWDSESAMESEILEALKHFGSHKRSGPVSQDLLAELAKLGVSPDSIGLSQAEAELLNIGEGNQEASPKHPRAQSCGLLEVPSQNSTYARANIEKRCAALKEEYLEYQRQQAGSDGDTEKL